MDEVKDATLSAEIDRLHAEHRRYAQRLEELLQKPYLSEDEQLEEVRLKKLKLHAKDLIFRARTQSARSSLTLQGVTFPSTGPWIWRPRGWCVYPFACL